MQETWLRFLDQEDPLEKEVATHSRILAWRIPWMGGAWWATVHVVVKAQTWQSNEWSRDILMIGVKIEGRAFWAAGMTYTAPKEGDKSCAFTLHLGFPVLAFRSHWLCRKLTEQPLLGMIFPSHSVNSVIFSWSFLTFLHVLTRLQEKIKKTMNPTPSIFIHN